MVMGSAVPYEHHDTTRNSFDREKPVTFLPANRSDDKDPRATGPTGIRIGSEAQERPGLGALRSGSSRWAGSRGQSDLRPLREGQGVLDVDTEIPNGVLDLGMAEKDLHGAQVAGCLVDDRCLGPPQRMRTIFLAAKADPYDPLIDETRILAGAEMIGMVDTAWEHVIAQRSAAALEPRQKTGPRVRQQLELDRSSGLPLDDGRSSSDLPAYDDVPDFEADDIATAQLAVDGNIEQRPIAKSPMLVEIEANAPYLFRLQSSL